VNAPVLAAGILCALAAAGHTAIGVRWVLPHLSEESLPHSPFGRGDMTLVFIQITWHVVGIAVLSMGVVLCLLARGALGDGGTIAVRGVGATFTGTTLYVLWLARRRPRHLLRAPMWSLFVAIAALCWSA
jgi:hypothetical protein